MNPLPDEVISFSLSRRDNMWVDTKESTIFDRAVRYGIYIAGSLLKNIWRTYGTRLFICMPISTDSMSLRDKHHLCPSFIFSHNLVQRSPILAQVFSAASLVTEWAKLGLKFIFSFLQNKISNNENIITIIISLSGSPNLFSQKNPDSHLRYSRSYATT